ncbi:hypothetical protein M959_05205, partial [Chaetura pelagica]
QDSVTQRKRDQMTWSVSPSALTTRRDYLVSQKHRKCKLYHFLCNSFLALEVETSKNQIHFHNGKLPGSLLYGIYKVGLKRKLIDKTSGIEGRQKAECRFLTSVMKNLEVNKKIDGKKMLNKLLFLGCLLHALASKKKVCISCQCRQKYSKTERTRHAVTACKVRRQRKKHIIAARNQNRTKCYILRTQVREVRVQVKAEYLKREPKGTKSSGGPDPEKLLIKFYKA